MHRLLSLFCALAIAQTAAAQKPFAVGVVPGALRYDVSRFDVHAGDEVRILFRNNGLMPHNLLVTKPGKVDAVMLAAMALGAAGTEQDFTPKTDDLLAASPVVQPGKAHLLRFTAPGAPGTLGYLCTFPGHGTIMRGEIRVMPKGTKLGAPLRFGGERAAAPAEDRLARSGANPFPLGSETAPLVMRTFLPDPGLSDEVLAHHERGLDARPYDVNSGRDKPGKVKAIDGLPAAIAVNFGGRLSYAWDTVECRLLYAWVGGFLDMSDYWGGGAGGGRKSFDYVPALQGSLIHVAEGPHPMGAEIEPRYLGYFLDDGVPVFRIQVGEFEIQQKITPGEGPFDLVLEYHVLNDTDWVQAQINLLFLLEFPGAMKGRVASEHLLEDGTTVEVPFTRGPLTARVVLTGAERLPPPDPYADLQRAGVVANAVRTAGEDPDEPTLDLRALAPGRPIFADRDYCFDDVPEALVGADHVPTRNGDKEGRGKPVQWKVTVAADASLWLLLDERIPAPRWVTNGRTPFDRTDLVVTTTGDWQYRVWRADVSEGATVALGPQGGGSFYAIAVSAR